MSNNTRPCPSHCHQVLSILDYANKGLWFFQPPLILKLHYRNFLENGHWICGIQFECKLIKRIETLAKWCAVCWYFHMYFHDLYFALCNTVSHWLTILLIYNFSTHQTFCQGIEHGLSLVWHSTELIQVNEVWYRLKHTYSCECHLHHPDTDSRFAHYSNLGLLTRWIWSWHIDSYNMHGFRPVEAE